MSSTHHVPTSLMTTIHSIPCDSRTGAIRKRPLFQKNTDARQRYHFRPHGGCKIFNLELPSDLQSLSSFRRVSSDYAQLRDDPDKKKNINHNITEMGEIFDAKSVDILTEMSLGGIIISSRIIKTKINDINMIA